MNELITLNCLKKDFSFRHFDNMLQVGKVTVKTTNSE